MLQAAVPASHPLNGQWGAAGAGPGPPKSEARDNRGWNVGQGLESRVRFSCLPLLILASPVATKSLPVGTVNGTPSTTRIICWGVGTPSIRRTFEMATCEEQR